MRKVMAFAMSGLVVLATVWLYNRYSGKSISDLGRKAA